MATVARRERPEDMRRPSWWRGTRGEWYVVAQFVLMGLVVLVPRTIAGVGALSVPRTLRWVGLAVAFTGLVGASWVGRRLGPALTPFPKPRRRAELVVTGPYAVVRHPIYTAILICAIGCTTWRASAWSLVATGLLFVLFELKARAEERWLVERFPDYAAYQRRVRRLIPFVY